MAEQLALAGNCLKKVDPNWKEKSQPMVYKNMSAETK